MFKSNWKKILLIAASIISIVIWVIYNIKYNDNFFQTPIIYILNLIVAVVFTYYFTQKKNDNRRFKEEICGILDKVQILINDPRLGNFSSEEDVQYAIMMHRTVSNKIQILEDNKEILNISSDIKVIRDKFNQYRDLVGNHNNDLEYLSKSSADMKGITSIIDDRIDKIRISLFTH